MRRRITRRAAAALLGILPAGVVENAHANVGLPLVAAFLPPLWLALLPVILIEAFVERRLLSLEFRKVILPVACGNIISTIAGIPILWVVLATLEGIFFGRAEGLESVGGKIYAVTIQSPWLIPYEESFGWMIPAALLVFALPCYLLSLLIEAPVNRAFLRSSRPAGSVWKATAIANLASYALLGAITGAAIIWGERWPTVFGVFRPVIVGLMSVVFSLAHLATGK